MTPPRRRARVLVVDDDPAIRELLEATFGHDEAEVSTAEDIEAALGALEATPPDVVLLDLDLPGALQGRDLLAHLRGRPGAPPCIVVSGSPDATEEELRAAGAQALFRKPFRPLALLDAVEAALRAGAPDRPPGRARGARS